MSYSLLKNTYSRKNEYIEYFTLDNTSTYRIMSSYGVEGNTETTELYFPTATGQKNKILSPDGNWKLELNKDGLQLFGPSSFKTTLVSGGDSFTAYKVTIGTDGNIVLTGGTKPDNVNFMWNTGAANNASDYWSLSVDNNGNIIRKDINENTDGEKLFTKIENNGASKNTLCFPGTSTPGAYYQRTLLSGDCMWRVELNVLGLQVISKDNRKITLYKPSTTTKVMKLLLNLNGQLLLFDGDNVVLKTKSFDQNTYNAVVNTDNGSIDISQGTTLKYETFVTDIDSYDDEGLRSDNFKCIISGNSNYLLAVDNEGLYIIDMSISSSDNKTWIYKNTIDLTDMVRFYEHPNFSGNYIDSKPGDSVSDLQSIGFNDIISSIYIPSGIKVTLYEHDNYQGWTTVLTSSIPFLDGYNDGITSYKVERVAPANPHTLIARLESYGEVKVYVNGTNQKDCLWWAGTSETTTDNGPYKLSVTNAGKMLIMNKNNLGLIYKELGPSANVSEILMIAVRQRTRGDCFWTPYDYGTKNNGNSLIVAQFDPKSVINGSYPGQFWWFPSSKCMVQAIDSLYAIEVDGGSSNYTGVEGQRILFWSDGCNQSNSLKITWDSNGYIKEDKFTKYFNRRSDMNSNPGDHIALYSTPVTKWDIVRISNNYTTIPVDSDCIMSTWSECDRNCKQGVQTRTKISSQSGEGKACTSENLTRTGFCGTTDCPVDCVVSDWTDWGDCSKDCGGGKRNRRKTITTASNFGGQACPPPSSLFEEEDCNTEACPPPGSTPPPPPKKPTPNQPSETPSDVKEEDVKEEDVEEQSFFDKYKWWIVGGSITFFFFIIIIIIVLMKNKKPE